MCTHLGDVPGGDRGDPGCDRAISVHADSGAALQADSSLHLQSSLPGAKQCRSGNNNHRSHSQIKTALGVDRIKTNVIIVI